MHKNYREKLSAFLSQFIYERRIARIDKVLNNRTNYISVVLEDIYQPHNASAVLRSCDCLGIQDVHIIENNYEYSYNTDVTKGNGLFSFNETLLKRRQAVEPDEQTDSDEDKNNDDWACGFGNG